jgi:hypothetical protein
VWKSNSDSQASLADRLSLTQTGAGYVIDRLKTAVVMEKTADAKADVGSGITNKQYKPGGVENAHFAPR